MVKNFDLEELPGANQVAGVLDVRFPRRRVILLIATAIWLIWGLGRTPKK